MTASDAPPTDLLQLGLDPARVEALVARAAREVEQGRLPSCQLALGRHGRLALSVTLGAAAPDARYAVFSVTKALTASAIWLLLSDGSLTPGTRVAELLPEFARDGLDAVTVEHLLTHTAGFPRAPMRPEEGATSAGRRARFAGWRLDWEPGSRTEYHPTSAHWVLGELVTTVTGHELGPYLTERVLQPLGLTRMRLGVPPDQQGDVVDVVVVGQAKDDPLVPVVADSAALLRFNEPAVRAVGVPGAGAVSTAADVALLYQAFLHDPVGLWDAEVLADATGRVRNSHPDPWTGVPANRTLGLVVAGDDGNAAMREFGGRAGPRTFGASGLGGQVAWADPDTGLSFSFLTNGLDQDAVQAFVRSAKLSAKAAETTLPPAITATSLP